MQLACHFDIFLDAGPVSTYRSVMAGFFSAPVVETSKRRSS